MKQCLLIALSAILFNGAFAQSSSNGKVTTKYGKGVTFIAADSSMSLHLSARIQPLFVAEKSMAEGSPIEKEMSIRRARIKMEGFAFTPKLEYKIELGFSNRDNGKVIPEGSSGANIILDAVLKYELSEHSELWFGQTKLPGNRERVVSSQKLQFVDRSLLNSNYNLDRDLGIQFHHKGNIGKAVYRDQYAISMGQGRNITVADTGGLSYTARFELLPFGEFTSNGDYFDADLAREPKPKLMIGAGYSYNDGATRQGGELGSFLKESRDLKTFFADATLKYKGWFTTTEYMNKKSDGSPIFTDSSSFFNTGDGWNIQSGYLFTNNYELAARYTVVNPTPSLQKTGREGQLKEYTLGLSKYISGHNLKIQTDLAYLTDQRETDGTIRYRFQVEMGF